MAHVGQELALGAVGGLGLFHRATHVDSCDLRAVMSRTNAQNVVSSLPWMETIANSTSKLPSAAGDAFHLETLVERRLARELGKAHAVLSR